MGNQLSINESEKFKLSINIHYVYNDLKFSNIDQIDNCIITEKYIKDTSEYELLDFEGYPLNGSYQNVLNVLFENQDKNTFYIEENNDNLEIGFILNNKFYIIECENLHSMTLDMNTITKTIKYILNKSDFMTDDIPKCIKKIFVRNIKSNLDFMRPIEDSDIIIEN